MHLFLDKAGKVIKRIDLKNRPLANLVIEVAGLVGVHDRAVLGGQVRAALEQGARFIGFLLQEDLRVAGDTRREVRR